MHCSLIVIGDEAGQERLNRSHRGAAFHWNEHDIKAQKACTPNTATTGDEGAMAVTVRETLATIK